MPIKEPNTIPAPTNPLLTQGTLEGTGLFDELMRTVKMHLKEEFEQSRITGADYARVYVGSIEAVLANSTQYVTANALIDVAREKILAEISLLELEAVKLAASIRLIELEEEKLRAYLDQILPLEVKKLEQELLLTEAKVTLIEAEVTMIPDKIRKLNAEADLMEAQAAKLKFEVEHMLQIQLEILELQKQKLANETDKILQEGLLIEAQIEKMGKEIELMDQQVINMQKQNEMLDKQIEKITEELKLVAQQILKMTAEVALIEAKARSEEATTNDTDSLGKTFGGTVKRQLAVLEAQKEGFAVDGYQKASRMFLEAYSIQRSTDEGFPVYGEFKEGESEHYLRGLMESLNNITESPVSATGEPTVGSISHKNVTTTGATLMGALLDMGHSVVTARGFEWWTENDPATVAQIAGTPAGPAVVEPFEATLNSPIGSNVVVIFRVYATNSTGTAYSSEDTFTTL